MENRVIEGTVNSSHEAVISLQLRGPGGQAREIEAVIDTGYSGFLVLPPTVVRDLGLPYLSHGQAILADGSEVTFNVHDVTVLWEGQPRHIEVDSTGYTPLAGMSLIRSHSLYVEVEHGGRVVIEARR